jgi:hypothetical protein
MEGQTWQFGGVELNTKAWSVIGIPDGIGKPGLRGSNIQVPFQNGRRWIKKRYEERIIMLAMWVRGVDFLTGKIPSGLSQAQTLYQNIEFLSSVFGIRGQQTLKRILPDGTEREALAEIYAPVSFVKKQAGYALFTVEFLLAEPCFYGVLKTQETKTINTDLYEWNHHNPGTALVTSAIITLTGPLEYPKLECLDSGVWVQYQGIISGGESVVIDSGDFSCEKGGSNMLSAIKHGGDAYWLILESGYNQLRLSCDGTADGSIKLEYYPAYF